MQIQVGTSAARFWDGVISGPLLFVNTDLVANIQVSNSPGSFGATGDVQVIPPLGSISVPGDKPWYAVNDQAGGYEAVLQITPGGGNWTAAPSQIASVLDLVALATDIAEAIAVSGVPLLASPTLIYDGQITSTSGTPGGWGVTVADGVPALYNPSSKNDAPGFDLAISTFDGIIGTPSKATKLFYSPSQYPTTLASMNSDQAGKFQACLDNGHKIYLCYQPGSVANSSGVITAINNTTTDRTNLLASINALSALAVAAGTSVVVVLYQEYNDTGTHSISAATYQSAFGFYGPSVRTAGYSLYACLASGTHSNWNTFVNSSLTTIDGLGIDYYASAYNSNVRIDSGNNGGATVGGVANNINAIATALNVPMGIFEIGSSSSGSNVPNSVVSAYITYCQGVLVNRMINGLTNLDSMWFLGTNQNFIPNASDFRVPPPGLQTFIPAVTTAPVTGIAAGATQVLAPLKGSAVADYASATGFSYDITTVLTASTGSTSPFAVVTLSWFNTDSLTAIPVATQSWYLPAGATGTTGTVITGTGPQRGQYLQIAVTNLDTKEMSVQIQANSSSRSFEDDVWKWDVSSSVAVPTPSGLVNFAMANGASNGKSLGNVNNVSVPASTTQNYLFGLTSGNAYFRFNCGSNMVNFTLKPLPLASWNATLLNESPGTEFTAELILPRGPVLFTVINNDGGAAHSVNAALVSLD